MGNTGSRNSDVYWCKIDMSSVSLACCVCVQRYVPTREFRSPTEQQTWAQLSVHLKLDDLDKGILQAHATYGNFTGWSHDRVERAQTLALQKSKFARQWAQLANARLSEANVPYVVHPISWWYYSEGQHPTAGAGTVVFVFEKGVSMTTEVRRELHREITKLDGWIGNTTYFVPED